MGDLRGRRGLTHEQVVLLFQQLIAQLDLVDENDIGDLVEAAVSALGTPARKYSGAIAATAGSGTADQVSTLVVPAGPVAVGSIVEIILCGYAATDIGQPEVIPTMSVTVNGAALLTVPVTDSAYRSAVVWRGEVTAPYYINPIEARGLLLSATSPIAFGVEVDLSTTALTIVATVSGGVDGFRGAIGPIVIITPPAPTS